MQKVLENDEIIVYITESEDEKVYLYNEFMIAKVINYTMEYDIIRRNDSIGYVRIYLCYSLIKQYKRLTSTYVKDSVERAELPEKGDINIQELLRVNDLVSKHVISQPFIKFFEQLVNEYIFEV